MDERRTGQARETVGIAPWALFETRLRAYLSTMIDASDEDVLVLHIPSPRLDGDVCQVVISTAEAGQIIVVRYPFEETGCAIDEIADMAWRIGQTIQSRYKTPHPDLLMVSASGPAAIGVGILGLADAATVGEDVVRDTAEPTFRASDRGHLRARVLSHVRNVLDQDAEIDPDGDVRFSRGGVRAYYRIAPHEPTIGLFALVVHGVRSRRQADTEVNVLNRRHHWSRWVRYGDMVMQEMSIPGLPYDTKRLDDMTGVFVADFRSVVPDLADRVGGTAVGG